MNKSLVVYYSRTGHTRHIAEALAAALPARREAIEERGGRAGLVGDVRSTYDAKARRLPAIREPLSDPAAFDLVIVGAPVWAGHPASPIQSYLSRFRGRLPALALFCTLGGGGAPSALREMAALAGRRPLVQASFTDGEIHDGRYAGKLTRFVEQLRAAAGAPAALASGSA